jgi:hypothetical protein
MVIPPRYRFISRTELTDKIKYCRLISDKFIKMTININTGTVTKPRASEGGIGLRMRTTVCRAISEKKNCGKYCDW